MSTALRELRPLSQSLVWRILRRYAGMAPSAGSQLNKFGMPRYPSGNAAEWALTVGAKLERYGAVARLLWLETAASWLRNIYWPALEHGQHVRLEDERPEVLDVLFEHGIGMGQDVQGDIERSLSRVLGARDALAWELTWLACEFAACADDDRGFLRELEGE